MKKENFNLKTMNEALKILKEDKNTFTCCICGKETEGYGNNPHPVKDDGECCDECNVKVIIPARLKALEEKENSYVADDTAEDIAEDFDEEDPKEVNTDYLNITRMGFEVKKIYESNSGRLYVIVYRPKRDDYALGAGYDLRTGYWAQGYYDFKNLEDVEDFLFDTYGHEHLHIFEA